MSETSTTPRGLIRQASKWTTATAVVATEAVQNFVAPESTVGVVNEHLHTGAYWSLGLQIVTMCAVKAYKSLKLRGSVTFSWGDSGGTPTTGEHGS
ncbi:hypothetical protein [Streptomyces sp. NBC_00989]|uniref:hypothetical protein n=1 Tax=Streptomyces sp. NBC_00989 TaxID=2903705 RepID=UPI002F90DC7C|nr:hypothetical protein OG714_54485 [Streptomyces sp. NBC_00989]